MSTHESDGIDEALQGITHVAMTAAGRVGEQLARMREQQAREAQARSAQAAQELAERMKAEQGAARASLTPVHRTEWWDAATAEDVTKAYTTARAWSDLDPEAMRAQHRIVDELRERYGVDVEADAEPGRVGEAVDRAERARAEAADERHGAGDDRMEAAQLMAAADATDRAADAERRGAGVGDAIDDARTASDDLRAQGGPEEQHERDQASGMREDAGHAYDSAGRREAMAEGLDHIENRAAVEARVRSDVAQGRPAVEAVTTSPGKAPKARPTKGNVRQPVRTAQRTGRSR